jgi:hypothetical protein
MLPRIYLAVSLISLTGLHSAMAFYCYTGDGEVIRTKLCPSIGNEHFTDICFKKFGTPFHAFFSDCKNSTAKILQKFRLQKIPTTKIPTTKNSDYKNSDYKKFGTPFRAFFSTTKKATNKTNK